MWSIRDGSQWRVPARFRAGTSTYVAVRRTVVPVPVPEALLAHVVATTGLTRAEAGRVIEDVVAFHAEPVEDLVRRRHAHLRTYGARNDEIFARLEELRHRVVAAPALSERQLRRIVYG